MADKDTVKAFQDNQFPIDPCPSQLFVLSEIIDKFA